MSGLPSVRIVMTGAAGTLVGLGAALATAGLSCEDRPLLGFGPPLSWQAMDDAIARLSHYAAVAITSPRAAESLIARARVLAVDLSAAPTVWSGAASADPLREVIPRVEVPAGDVTEPAGLAVRLAAAMLAAGVGSPVLFPCGEVHREELLVRLRAAGRRVEPLIAYRAVVASPEAISAAIARGDILVVTSPRVAQQLAATAPVDARPSMVAIGTTTADAAAAAGWSPDAVAMRPSVADVVGAIHALLPSLT